MADGPFDDRAVPVLNGEGDGRGEFPRPARLGRRFVAAILTGSVIAPINTTMISVALVPISEGLGVGPATVLWLIVSLYLVSAVCQPVMGVLADRIGPRRVSLLGLLLVALGGLLPVVAPAFGTVLVARILLGAGSAASYPAAMTLIRRRAEARGSAAPSAVLAGLSIAGMTSAAIGPLLGGGLVLVWGWPAVFAINVPLAATAAVLTLLWIPRDAAASATGPRPEPARRTAGLDPVGMLLFTVATTALVFLLLDLSLQAWWLLGVTAASGGALVWWELRHDRPFLDLRLMAARPALARTYARLFLTYLGPYVVVYAVSQWVQDDLGLSSGEAGLLQAPSLVLAGLASVAVARTRRALPSLVITAALAVVGGVLLASANDGSPIWLVALTVGLFGIPQGLASVSNQMVIYRVAPTEQIGAASGLSRTAISLTAITASALIGLTFGSDPSSGGVAILGGIVAAAGLGALALTLADRPLRRGDTSPANAP